MCLHMIQKEMRCQGCGKLLAEKAATGTVIVCTRCKTRNEAD
jgi:phage FluMu protein Com